ncbi:MAG: hypothetical protein IH851_02885 [Armatimonadetes bacterium]|nr:hypothetical protein [Armatimonadota bacterium]
MRLAVLAGIGLLLGACGSPEPPGLTGVWRCTLAADDVITLELREDGTFLRTAQLGEQRLKQWGSYRVEMERVVYEDVLEGLEGERGTESYVVIKEPYEMQEGVLVLYPGSQRERRFARIE